MPDREPAWSLTVDERATLEGALDALLPPAGSFPAPSETRMIDDFILRRIPAAETRGPLPYPRIDSNDLKATLQDLARLAGDFGDITRALERLEQERPQVFAALWRLAVYGYYSRRETIAAIRRELASAYHGAPQPLGYAFALEPWDPDDPLQMPAHPRGSYIRTEDVQRVDLSALAGEREGH